MLKMVVAWLCSRFRRDHLKHEHHKYYHGHKRLRSSFSTNRTYRTYCFGSWHQREAQPRQSRLNAAVSGLLQIAVMPPFRIAKVFNLHLIDLSFSFLTTCILQRYNLIWRELAVSKLNQNCPSRASNHLGTGTQQRSGHYNIHWWCPQAGQEKGLNFTMPVHFPATNTEAIL